MDVYYEQLAIDEEASLEEIKEAYFRKVQEAFATDDKDKGLALFYHSHEAFTFLTGKKIGLFYNTKKETYRELTINKLADWENKFESKKEKLHEQAVNLYKLGRDPFLSSLYYKHTLELKEEAHNGKLGLALFLTFVIPVGLTLLLDMVGLTLGMIVVYSTSFHWQKTFRQMFFTSKTIGQQSLAYLLNMQFSWIALFLGSNLLLLFFSTAKTFILFKPLMGLFILATLVGFLVPTRKLGIFKGHSRLVSGLGLFPFFLNLFFAINLNLSFPLIQESHEIFFDFEYIPSAEMRDGEIDIKPRIYLEDNLYEDYLHIRQFRDRDIIRDKHIIHMDIHRGLFGLRVLKSWKLE